ncbi:MAG: hypothetical protein IT307_17765, partial [Chloroflexi bacterium]|nr:hypothetical protein [Chloroflexota bacterium]
MLALRRRAADGLALVALAVACLSAYGGLLRPDFMLADYDAMVYFYPPRVYYAEALAAGRLPLWNPYHFLGAPFLANPQTAVLYPPSLLFLLMSVPLAYGWSLALHLMGAGLGVYCWCRSVLETDRAASFLAGLAFM